MSEPIFFTRNQILAIMKNIVDVYVENYKSDFTDYDVPYIKDTNNFGEYLWIVREQGTYLFQTKSFNNKIIRQTGEELVDEELESLLKDNKKSIESVLNTWKNRNVYILTIDENRCTLETSSINLTEKYLNITTEKIKKIRS